MTCDRFHLVGIVGVVLALVLCSPAFAQVTDPHKLLVEADRLAWLRAWTRAEPLYAEAREAFVRSGDRRNALYAEVSRLRGQLPTLPVTCRTVCSTIKTVNQFKRQLKDDVGRLEREVKALEDGGLERLKQVHAAIISGLDVLTKAIDLKLRANQIALEYFSKDQAKSPLRRILQNWHDDINTAMSAFVTANGEAMVGTIIGLP